MADYPEHKKFAPHQDASNAIGAFLEWLDGKGIQLCIYPETMDKYDEAYVPITQRTDELIAEYFGVDLKTFDAEKKEMLEEIRQQIGERGEKMGLFDYIEGPCPYCGVAYSGQTKMFGCQLKTIRAGDRVPNPGTIKLKTPCADCGKYPVMYMSIGGILGLVQTGDVVEYKKEGFWGSASDDPQSEPREEQSDE